MFGRKQQPLSAAQKLSLHVQRAGAELQQEKEELEVLQVLFRGAAAYASQCETEAMQRGSPAAFAFRAIGQASQGMATGADRVVAALPPADPAAARAMRQMLGVPEPKIVEADETVDSQQ
jgi:hypothetical protein